MADSVRWGILGTGKIAGLFAQGLRHAKGARLVAVGSRSQHGAEAFGGRYAVPRRHDSYAKLAADPEVDVIYIATPHSRHHDNALLCLEHDKAVLCEKPFTIHAAQAEVVIAAARERNLFLMEAMWTRFVPAMVRLRELLAAGVIGDVRMVGADFGVRARLDPASRLFDPNLGGGALLDLGVYAVSLASMILGTPTEITGFAELGETGVDEQGGMVLRYRNGRLATLMTAATTMMPCEATIMGTDGFLRLHHGWFRGSRMTLQQPDRDPREIDVPTAGNGYHYEAEEVGRCLAAGRTESAVMPLRETLQIMRTMDELRRQWKLRYPME